MDDEGWFEIQIKNYQMVPIFGFYEGASNMAKELENVKTQ
jgi:hypothetical protein